MRVSVLSLSALMLVPALAACNVVYVDKDDKAGNRQAAGAAAPEQAAASDFAVVADGAKPPVAGSPLHVQVMLDRIGFSSGVIDGKDGLYFGKAVRGFQVANDLTPSGKVDDATRQALARWDGRPAVVTMRIPAAFAQGPFFAGLPSDAAEQAKLPELGYRDLTEKLSERFHTTPEMLASLNGGKTVWKAGETIRVPNIEAGKAWTPEAGDRGWGGTLAMLAVSADQQEADHVVVDKSEGVLKVFGPNDRLIAQFPATMGSEHDPLPLGRWTIKGVSRNPDFHYNPALFWDAAASDQKVVLKPGPNGPVGVVWIDISKPHYGIHGTPEPRTIGRSESHGCIRLTNWDAARLAQMVKAGVTALFQP